MITINDVKVIARAKGGEVIFEGMLSGFPADIIAQAAAYAIHKKAQDASGGKDLTGAEAIAAGKSAVEAMLAGTWAKRGGGGPRARDEDSFVASRVLAKVKATIKAKKASMPTDAALAAHVAKIVAAPQHAAWISALRTEYAAKQVSVDIDFE
jgi:hypothetical protein